MKSNMQTVLDQISTLGPRLQVATVQLDGVVGGNEMGEKLTALSVEVQSAISELVQTAAESLKEAPVAESDELLAAYHINFEWAEMGKEYLLLWRDSLFELAKGLLGVTDGKYEAAKIAQLVQEVRAILQQAASELVEKIPLGIAALQPVNRDNKKKLSNWRLQKNPWPIYEKQFAEIPQQCDRIWKSEMILAEVALCYAEIRRSIFSLMEESTSMSDQIDKLVDEASEVCSGLLKTDPEKNLGKLASKLEDYEGMLDLPNLLSTFNPHIEECLEKLPEDLEFPANINGGMVEIMHVHFQRKTQSWLKSEVLPLLYEIWELAEASRNQSRMTFVNLQNWAIMLSHEIKDGKEREVDPEELVQLVTELKKRLVAFSESIAERSVTARERMDADFHLMEAFAPEREFLPVQMQSTIEQLRENQDKFFEGIRKFFLRMAERARQFLKQVEKEESLSTAEKVVRYLQEREPDPQNAQYTSMFLTKGFVSTSFIVGREEEFQHAEQVIDNWRKGYRGSLLITGRRLSGKSLFGEMVANRCFDHRTIRLHPRSIFTVEGRKYETTCDLGQALEHIRRHTLTHPTLIWIDDLEAWWDGQHSYHQNGAALKYFLEHQGRNTFLMVSMGNNLRPRLDKLLDWNNLFFAHINLDKMSAADVREAILIRHSATHQELVNENGQELTPNEFKKLTQAIHSSSAGNIGEALNKWAFSSRYLDEDSVTNHFKTAFPLPDFLDPDLGILLSSIMMQRRTNESYLRRKFGPAFSPKYALLIRRMLSTGVLERGMDGWLEVNPIMVNDLGDLLQRKRYLRYKY